MSASIGFVQCSIEVYTFEGGKYAVSQEQVLACEINHSALGGRFNFTLAPGGPNGILSSPSWTEVFTPMSTVVIAMSRANAANVVMVGFVENTTETQSWQNAKVIRTTNISGSDVSIYFNKFNWYLFPNLQGNTLSILAGQVGGVPQAELGVTSGFPQQIANAWLQNLMIGPSGILGKTFFNYNNGQVFLRDGMQVVLENAPYIDIPYGDNFFSEVLSWSQKFQAILPFPQYEIIFGTAPTGTWDTPAPSGSITYPSRNLFYSVGIPNAVPAIPQFIGRILRLPNLGLEPLSQGQTNYNFTGADVSLWAQLPQFSLANNGFIQSQVTFGTFEYKNYYAVNPTWYTSNFGGGGNNIAPFAYLFYGLADPASIHRYGFAPYIFNTRWFADISNVSNVNSQPNIADSAARVTTRLASYTEPMPLMARGSVTMELRPDIFYGCIFNYIPFRDTIPWMFYINGITHSYRFGGPSTTTLNLDRGFPIAVYQNPDLLFNILRGNAQRIDGTYQVGLPSGLAGPSLAAFGNSNTSQQNLLTSIAQAYVTPQQK